MIDPISAWQPPRDGILLRPVHIAIALSLLLHAAALWLWKHPLTPPPDKVPPPLTVKLEPLPGPPPSKSTPPPARAIERPAQVAQPAPPPLSPERTPPVIALKPPTPNETPTPVPMRAPPAVDLAAYVEAQRRARGESPAAPAQPAEDENARATRLATANLATPKAQGMGYDPDRSGGIFTIRRVGVDYAEFMFYGWHADARRDMAQLIEVRKGNHSDIQLAVVRKMIEIIRVHVQADFTWRSHRMNKVVTLSARQRDNAGLEEFMLREFFYNPRLAP